MRSKKDKDSIVIVTTDDKVEFKRLLDNNTGWEEVKKPELDSLLLDYQRPNRAERRRQQFGKGI